MKKIIALFMGMLLVFSLAACSNADPDKDTSVRSPELQGSDQASDVTSSDSATKPADSSNPANETGKTLVVYYSASGNTESAASYIAAATDGDTFELVPKDNYSDADLNYRDNNSRVVYEHDHPEERNIELEKNTVDNWDEYDTVFIGYPIWWQIAAWPVDSFVKANDFTGKTVIPFCTSASSGLGESGKLLSDMAGTGNWLEGQRFSSGVSEQTVREWVESLPPFSQDTRTDIQQTNKENITNSSQEGNLSGVVPRELEYIPDGYARPAEHPGTLEKLTYQTWESFTYENHEQNLTKDAWVYLPYGYSKKQKYNIMYISHGGWSNETTIMGTDSNPRSFKHVIDHAIEDGKMKPLIIVLPTYNNTSGSDSGASVDFPWAL